MVNWSIDDFATEPNDLKKGWRMVIMIIRDSTYEGGIFIRTDLCRGDMDWCKKFVNDILPNYQNRVIGWKITGILPCDKQ